MGGWRVLWVETNPAITIGLVHGFLAIAIRPAMTACRPTVVTLLTKPGGRPRPSRSIAIRVHLGTAKGPGGGLQNIGFDLLTALGQLTSPTPSSPQSATSRVYRRARLSALAGGGAFGSGVGFGASSNFISAVRSGTSRGAWEICRPRWCDGWPPSGRSVICVTNVNSQAV